MHRTLDALRERGCSFDVLESSWRSRPPLVRYLNTVFAAAFERDNIDRALVELAPQREETHGAPAVMRWTLPRGRATEQADAFAGAIADLVESQLTVNDPETHKTRAVGYGDIAVLAATDDHVDCSEVQVAYAIGVSEPVSVDVETFGTARVDEGRLATLVREHFDLRPGGVIEMLDLARPIYQPTEVFGHFGRDEPDFTWERTDRAVAFADAAGQPRS